MEKILIEWFGSLALFVVPILSGVVTSFIVEAINYVTPKALNSKMILTIVSVVAGVLLIFGFPQIATNLFDKILIAVMNVVVAIIFYMLGGKVIVTFLVEKALGTVKNKADNVSENK